MIQKRSLWERIKYNFKYEYNLDRKLKYYGYKVWYFISEPAFGLTILCLEAGVLIYGNLKVDLEKAEFINTILINAIGIFSAILITGIINGISRVHDNVNKLKEEIRPYEQKVSALRKLLYYIIKSENIWGRDDYNYLTQIRKMYPGLKEKYIQPDKVSEEDDRYELINDERYDHRKRFFYSGMLRIINIQEYYEIRFLESYENHYNLKYLRYTHDSFNELWYYTQHKRAEVSISYENIWTPFKSNFEEEFLKILPDQNPRDFNRDHLGDIGSTFYEVLIPKYITAVDRLRNALPMILIWFYIQFTGLLIFGIIIPILNLSEIFSKPILVTKISLGASVFIFLTIIISVGKYVFSDSFKNRRDYT